LPVFAQQVVAIEDLEEALERRLRIADRDRAPGGLGRGLRRAGSGRCGDRARRAGGIGGKRTRIRRRSFVRGAHARRGIRKQGWVGLRCGHHSQYTAPMAKSSELETSALGFIWRDGPVSAYAVRRFYLDSPTLQWSGSAGAIYPLLARMKRRGLVRAVSRPTGRRPAQVYSIT